VNWKGLGWEEFLAMALPYFMALYWYLPRSSRERSEKPHNSFWYSLYCGNKCASSGIDVDHYVFIETAFIFVCEKCSATSI
jgi:hypothetical protein